MLIWRNFWPRVSVQAIPLASRISCAASRTEARPVCQASGDRSGGRFPSRWPSASSNRRQCERGEADLQRTPPVSPAPCFRRAQSRRAEAEQQMRAAAPFGTVVSMPSAITWYPMLFVVDERSFFAPTAAGEVSDDARNVSPRPMTNLMCRRPQTRARRFIATQRLAKLAKNVARGLQLPAWAPPFLDIDMMRRCASARHCERPGWRSFRRSTRRPFHSLSPLPLAPPSRLRIACETSGALDPPKLMPLPEQPLPRKHAI